AASVRRSREAHVPRHRHVVRRPRDRLQLPGVPLARPARPPHARGRGGGDRRRHAAAHRHAARAPHAARGQRDRPGRRRAVHARPRRPHPRHRRPAGREQAARRAAPDVRLRRHARRPHAEVQLHLRRHAPAPGELQARGARAGARGRRDRDDRRGGGDAGGGAARAPHRLRLPHRPARLRHRRQVAPAGRARRAARRVGARDQRPLLDRAPHAPLDPRGDRGRAAGGRGAHLPHAPHARQPARRPRVRAAARRDARVRRADGAHRRM
ncbi:MAG: Metal-dependent hydrolases of the beta-lactamase superfamily I; PhnP protein, partial [uncultured Gemmatimonadaceae bacterium]